MSEPVNLDLDARASQFETVLHPLVRSSAARSKRVAKGDVLLREGDIADALYLLFEGRLGGIGGSRPRPASPRRDRGRRPWSEKDSSWGADGGWLP